MSEITMYRGDSAYFTGIVAESGDETPIDITGAKLYFTAKYALTDIDVNALIAIDTTGAYMSLSDPTNGEYLIHLVPGHTSGATMSNGRASLLYDVQYKSTNSDVYTIDTGTLVILQDITQRIT